MCAHKSILCLFTIFLLSVTTLCGCKQEFLDSEPIQQTAATTGITAGVTEAAEPDFGITMTVADVSDSGLTVTYTQNGTQLPGTLYGGNKGDYHLEYWDGHCWILVQFISGHFGSHDVLTPECLIGPGETRTFRHDWQISFGALPAGNYRYCREFTLESQTDAYSQVKRESRYYYAEFSVAETTDPWGIELFAVSGGTASGVTLGCIRTCGSPYDNIATGDAWWLEVWDGGRWRALEPAAAPAFQGSGWAVPGSSMQQWSINWGSSYGILPEGRYRIGKTFTAYPTEDIGYGVSSADETNQAQRTYYCRFEIDERGTFHYLLNSE